MAHRLTPADKAKAGPDKVQAFLAYAESIRCVVVGDHIACNHKQKAILLKWWRENVEQ